MIIESIAPTTVIQDRYYVLRVLRPVEFGWLYSVVDRGRGQVRSQSRNLSQTSQAPQALKTSQTLKTSQAAQPSQTLQLPRCLLEEFVVPESVKPYLNRLAEQITLEVRQLRQVCDRLAIGAIPDYGEVICYGDRLLLKQFYGEHFSYTQVLEDRALTGEGESVLSEAEAWELLEGVIPILALLHRQGLSHGNLSPDTLVWRMAEQKPGLMHFGAVRSILQRVIVPLHGVLFEPSIQSCPFQTDWVNLAETVLVLLGNPDWNQLSLALAQRLRSLLEASPQLQLPLSQWPSFSTVQPAVQPSIQSSIIDRNLSVSSDIQSSTIAPSPQTDRSDLSHTTPFHSKKLASSELGSDDVPDLISNSFSGRNLNPNLVDNYSNNSNPLPVAPTALSSVSPTASRRSPSRSARSRSTKHHKPLSGTRSTHPLVRIAQYCRTVIRSLPSFKQDPTLWFMGALAFGLAGLLGYRILSLQSTDRRADGQITIAPSNPQFPLPSLNASGSSDNQFGAALLSPEIQTQLRSLQVSEDWFIKTVDELVDQPGRSPADAQWQTTGKTLLQVLEKLTPEARQGIGSYRRSVFDRWLTQAAKPMTSKQLEAQTDQQFFVLFPDRKGKTLNPRQLGQVWYAIARQTIEQH